VGDVKIRYYVTRGGGKWAYWAPCLERRDKKTGKIEPTLMARLGFKLIDLGRAGPQAWAAAENWNRKWDAALNEHRSGRSVDGIADETAAETRDRRRELRVYPQNSVGEGFARYRKTNDWRKTKKPRTREDWWRGWDLMEPVFGDVDPRTISLEDVDLWYGGDPNDAAVQGLLQTVGVREAHRAMKIWRALWPKLASIKRDDGERYVDGTDPSLGIRRTTPTPRSAFWFEGEAVILAKQAWRMEYYGLAAAMAVAWDTMLSPVDVRGLMLPQLRHDGEGSVFDLARAKTGKAAIGSLSRRAERILNAYLATLPRVPKLRNDEPIFRTRGHRPTVKGGKPRPPVPYTADTLGDDFRDVREAVFPGDTRTISDFRRSGSIEVDAGGADRKVLATKMANTIDKSPALQATYLPQVLPPDTSVVRLADAARLHGRARLRGSREVK
jgi:hypothetical protein